MALDCPKCGLLNPPNAQRCDCGFDFSTGTMQQSYLGAENANQLMNPTPVEMLVCIFLPVVGVFMGLFARRGGRRSAGTKMLVLSVVMFVVWLGIRLLIRAALSNG
jgi:hypothetical protein